MPTLRIGAPLPGHFSDLPWKSMTVFDMRRILWSSAIGCIVAGGAAVVWKLVDEASLPLGPMSGSTLFILFAAVICHEALHLLGFPGGGMGRSTVIGVWPQLAAPYVQYRLPMKRHRFILATMLPFLVLSIVPFFFALRGVGPLAYLSWLSVLNCVGAGSDLFISGKVFFGVPSDALVMESDSKIYWTGQ